MARKKPKKAATNTDAASYTKPSKSFSASTPMPAIIPFYSAGFWAQHWWKALIIFALPFLLYYPAIYYGYVLDDVIVVSENQFTTKGFGGIVELFTTESMTGYFGEQQDVLIGNRYRPLSLITFAIEIGIMGGMKPGVSHFINILLYGLTGVLLYRVLAMMMRRRPTTLWWLAIPFLTSLLYVAHPIHSEAVANIKGRDEIMALFFSLATLYGVLRYMDRRSVGWLISSCVLFFLALLSKENSITFLAVIPMTVYFFSEYKWRPNLIATSALIGTTVLYLFWRFSVAGVPEFDKQIVDLMNNPFAEMKGGEKLATIMFTLYKYLQLYIFPHPLNHDYYPYEIPILSWADIRSMGSLLLYIGLFVWAMMGLRKKKISSYAVLYYLFTLTIVSNIVVNVGTFMNERFIFMASVGLALLMVYLIVEKLAMRFGGYGKWIATGLSVVLLLGYSIKTYTRVPDWESALSLNSSAVAHGSNSARANSFMATALYNEAQSIEGADKNDIVTRGYQYAEKAVQIYPRYQNGNLMKAGLATEQYKIDRDEKKLLMRFAEVMSSRPDISFINEYLEYLEPRTSDLNYLLDWYADTSINQTLLKANHPKWALHYLNRAYALDSNNKKVLSALATVYSAMGDSQRSANYQAKANQQ